jgi:DNA-binding XRE family transcriptional regulator
MQEFSEIDGARARAHLTEYALCKRAGVRWSTYWRVKTGRQARFSARTCKRLLAALEGAVTEGKNRAPATARGLLQREALSIAYNFFVTQFAQELGLDPLRVRAAVPQKKATNDPFWLQAAEARGLAIFALQKEYSLTWREIGKAVGVTKQAAWKASRRIEDHYDNDPMVKNKPKYTDIVNLVVERLRNEPGIW